MITTTSMELEWYWGLKTTHILHILTYNQAFHSLFPKMKKTFQFFEFSCDFEGHQNMGLNLPN